MSFQQLNFQICVKDWGGCCSGAGYLKHWRKTHPNQDLQPPSTSGTQLEQDEDEEDEEEEEESEEDST